MSTCSEMFCVVYKVVIYKKNPLVIRFRRIKLLTLSDFGDQMFCNPLPPPKKTQTNQKQTQTHKCTNYMDHLKFILFADLMYAVKCKTLGKLTHVTIEITLILRRRFRLWAFEYYLQKQHVPLYLLFHWP